MSLQMGLGRWTAGIVCMSVLGMTFTVSAQNEVETLSIWKLERDTYPSGKVDFYSLLDQKFDFTSMGGSYGRVQAPFTGTPVTLPDGLKFLESSDNFSALKVNNGALKNAVLIPYLELTNSWTIEGWYSWPSHPNTNSWQIVFGTRNSGDGWFVTHRNRDGVLQFELYSNGSSGAAIADGTVIWANLPEEMTNTWKHLALTYDVNATGTPGKGVWKFYVDGENIATVTNRTAVTGKINNSAFYIGGREGTTSTFSVDYWRVSRGVLTPEQFLNANGVLPANSDTLAYYRLDQDSGFNNVAGNSYRLSADYPHGWALSEAYNYVEGLNIAPSMMQAFDECPNPSVNLVNSGSVRLYGDNSRLVHSTLGEMLEPDKPFTIEGWVYRMWAPSSSRGWTMMFGTRNNSNGFALWYGVGGTSSFGLYCATTGGVMRADQ
ncbi:MAG: LamG domain-containing protein, partial [Kiritimatiellae bacterium]|nr:LamG domain-containing protein [Kiritimatiellia bacterium]